MRARPDFKKAAYEAAKILCQNGLGDMVLAFDYKIKTLPTNESSDPKYGAEFFTLPADTIVQSVVAGDLPLE